MRILIVTTDFLPNLSGIATLSYEQARGLADIEHVVHVLTAAQDAAAYSVNDKFTVIEHTTSLPPVIRLKSFIAAVSKTVETWKPDFIWCPNYRGFGLPVMKIARSRKIAYGLYIHGTELQTESRNKLRHRILQIAMQDAKVLCTNSKNTAELVQKLYGVTATPLTPGVNPPPADTPEFLEAAKTLRAAWLRNDLDPSDNYEKLIFLSACRMSKQKGIDYVLRALAMLNADTKSKILYVAVGSGESLEEFKQLATTLQISEHVIFYGAATRTELATIFKSSDIYLQPSQPDGDFLESFGISFLEAQAAGLPCIGTNWGGVPEAVQPGITAQLIPTGSVEAIAKAISDNLSDSTWRQNAANEGPKWAAQNSWSTHTQKLAAMITS